MQRKYVGFYGNDLGKRERKGKIRRSTNKIINKSHTETSY
jgi:hypothetical protein